MLKYGRAVSGLLGPISSSEREPASADLWGRLRLAGLLPRVGRREAGRVAFRDVCLDSSVLVPPRRFRQVT